MKPSYSRSLLGRSSTLAILAMLGAADPAGAVDITITSENRPGLTNAGLLEFIQITDSTINGNVTNLPAGVIDPGAGNDGIYITDSTVTGSVLNQGRIIDANTGILIYGAVTSASVGGDVGNSGTIEADYGIDVYSNATVGGNVFNSGRIEGQTGIYVYDARIRGNVSNSGTIDATSIGIYITGATIEGAVVNGGVINSTNTGIYVYDSTILGGIRNSGTIDSDSSRGIYLLSSDTFAGGIENSGLIESLYDGIYVYSVDTFAGGIVNSGTIEVDSSYGIQLYSVDTVIGGINNSGTIDAYSTGIYVYNTDSFAGGIVNSGVIESNNSRGIYISSVGTFIGGINNSGTIDSYYTGIYVYNTDSFAGGIVNSGVIDSHTSYGIYISSVDTFVGGINNSGTIDAYYTGIYVYSVDTFAGGIVNSGVIDTYTSMGIFVSSVDTFTGGINNSGTIDAYYTGIYVYSVDTFAGGIVNSGVIDSSSSVGILVTDVDTFIGGIVNSGTIRSYYEGINLQGFESFAGGIVNSGYISSSEEAIYVTSGTIFEGGILNSGTIDSDYIAINVTNVETFTGGIRNSGAINTSSYGIYLSNLDSFSGGIANSGTILSSYTGIYVYSVDTFDGGIVNSGVISTDSHGIYLSSIDTFTGGISNSGTIRSDYSFGIYVYDSDTFAGGVANSGVIEASYVGIYLSSVDTFTGGVSNSGTIRSEYSYGISISDVSSFAGGIANSGVIESSYAGIYLYSVTTFAGGISNSGTIDSDESYGIYVSDISTFTGDLANSGTIDSDDTGIYVNSVTTFFGSIVNSGLIDSFDSYGIYVTSIDTMSGGISNSGLINSDYTAIYVNNVDTMTGAISNSGTIDIGLGGTYGIYVANSTVVGGIVNTGLIDPDTGIYVTASSLTGGIRNSGTILADNYAINALNLGTDVDVFLDAGLVRGDIGLPTAGAGNVVASGGVMEGDIIGSGTDDDLNVEGDFHIDGAVTLMDEVNANAGTATFHGNVDGQTFSLADGARAIMGVDVDNDTGFTGTFVNPWTANPDGTLAVEVAGAEGGSSAGQWIFGAGTTVDGNFQAVVLPDLYEDVTTYAGVVQTGGFAGAFTNVSDTSAFLNAELVVNGNNFDLVLTRTAFNALAGGGDNANGLGGVLEAAYQDYLGGNPIDPDLLPVIQTLFATNGEDANEFMAQVAGSSYAQSGYLAQAIMQQVYGFLQNRQADSRAVANAAQSTERGQTAALGDSDTVAGLTQEASTSHPVARGENGFSVWGEGLAGFGSRDGDDEAQGYDRDSWGAAIGLDYLMGESFLIGAAGHYLATSADFDGFGDEVDVDSFGFSLYGSWQPGQLYVDVGANVSFNSYESTRYLPTGLGTEEFEGDYDGTSYGFYAESGWRFDLGRFAITPSAGIAYTSISTDSFTETGTASGLALQSDGIDADSFTTTLMVRANSSFEIGGMLLAHELRVGWQHEFLDAPEADMAFVVTPNSPFTVVGSEVVKDSALIGTSLSLGVMSNVEVFIDYKLKG